MKKFALILVSIMFLFPVIGCSSQVAEKLGPYQVNFSLPVDLNIYLGGYHTECFEGNVSDSYTLTLRNETNYIKVFLFVTHYDNAVSEDPGRVIGKAISFMEGNGYFNDTVYNREIDDHEGILIGGQKNTIYLQEGYFWDYFYSRHTRVLGFSALPWGGGTLQLLKTIHVVQLNKTLTPADESGLQTTYIEPFDWNG
jgi:hypothetical protein